MTMKIVNDHRCQDLSVSLAYENRLDCQANDLQICSSGAREMHLDGQIRNNSDLQMYFKRTVLAVCSADQSWQFHRLHGLLSGLASLTIPSKRVHPTYVIVGIFLYEIGHIMFISRDNDYYTE